MEITKTAAEYKQQYVEEFNETLIKDALELKTKNKDTWSIDPYYEYDRK